MPPHGHHRFRNILGQAHGSLAFSSQCHHQGFDLCPRFTPVSASHVRNHHADARQGIVEDVDELELNPERVRRGSPNCDPFCVHLGNRNVWFHGVVVHHGKGEGVFHDRIGLGKPDLNIPFLEFVAEADVSGRRSVDLGGPIQHRLFGW